MTKNNYTEQVWKFGLEFFSWLETLPCFDAMGEPVELKYAVPLVHYPIAERDEIVARVKGEGFHFAPSTIMYVDGCHIPKGHELRALVKDAA